MKALDRFKALETTGLDSVLTAIRDKQIQVGRYAHLVKIKDKKLSREELLNGRDAERD